jgi:arginase
MDLGATRSGASTAPAALRAAGLSSRLARFTSTRDLGDVAVPARHVAVPGEENARYLGEIALACQRVYDRVTESANARRRTLVLGGDHAIAAGSVAAASEAALRRGGRLGVLWIDAHGDCNTEWTTPSGNVHGMPVASLLGFGPDALCFGRPLSARQLVMLGVRELDPGEARFLDHLAIERVPADEVAAVHADRMAAHLLAILDLHGRCDTLHVSLDMDGLDPLDAPGVGTPVPNGLRLLPTLALLRAVAARRCEPDLACARRSRERGLAGRVRQHRPAAGFGLARRHRASLERGRRARAAGAARAHRRGHVRAIRAR